MINDHLENKIAQLDSDIEAHTGGIVTSATQRNRVLCNLEMNREAADTHIANREFLKSNGVTVPRFSVKEIPGITLDNLQGDNIEQVLATWVLSEYDRYLLENYMAKNHASVAKFKKMLLQVCDDGTIKGNLQYHGAGTGRDAARGVQLQNLPRATAKDPEQLLKWFALHDTATLDMIFEILETASTLIRPSLQAPVGSKFVVSDYGQVEARGAAWTAKEEKILQNFRDGVPVYEAQAADMYDVAIDDVEPLQRQYGKLAVLACGYQGSHKALTKFAENYGLTIERKEAGKVVRAFRTSRPLLVDSWSNFGAAAVAATNAPGKRIQVPKCQHAVFQMQGKHLTLELPSGRKIWYPEADVRVVTVRYEDEETGETRTFQAESVTCKKLVGARWLRGGISGGNFFQNYVQAICRDMIMVAALRAGKAGYPVVGRIHDELITLVPDDSRYSIAELNKIMEVLPEWATNFPIKAAGYESKRYKK